MSISLRARWAHWEPGGSRPQELPATELLSRAGCLSEKVSIEELVFCYEILARTLDALIAKDYQQFDGHTATNCCHGVALYAAELLTSLAELNLECFQVEVRAKIQQLQGELGMHADIWEVPAPLLELAVLYALNHASKTVECSWRKAAPERLRILAPLSNKKCRLISRRLQRYVSNVVARNYSCYAACLPANMESAAVPLSAWSRYVTSPYLRVDKEGREYASHVFAMRVVIGYLAHQKAKVILVNDLLTVDGRRRGRLIQAFIGDGFTLVPVSVDHPLFTQNLDQPITVFGGCSYSDAWTGGELIEQMDQRKRSLDDLILACDLHCDQFPAVSMDSLFDSSPVIPHEECLQQAMREYAAIPGVSENDPSVFCLSHVYLAHLNQVQQSLADPLSDALPVWTIDRPTAGQLSTGT